MTTSGDRAAPRALPAIAILLIGGLAACSSSVQGAAADGGNGAEGGTDAGADGSSVHHDSGTGKDAGVDSSFDSGPDNGEASTTYPAFQPPVPQFVLAAGNGVVMAAPHLRPIYFAGDTWATPIDDAVSQWLASSAWPAQTTEYGIGAGTLDTPVMLTESAPAALTDVDVQTWLQGKLDGTHPEFGPVDAATLANEIFMIDYPSTTTISAFGGTSCHPFGGYHAQSNVGANEVVYVVTARCLGDLSGTIAILASYEMLSTAGDPLTQTQPGYRHFDVDHLAWNLLYGAVDLPGPCSGYYGQQSYARSWSNAAIRGYHDPCVPTHDATPYFVSVPLMNDALTFQGQTTKGIHVPVGQSATVEVDLLSDGATSGPWTVDAQVMPKVGYPASALTFMWDRNEPLGTNGEKLHLTVTANVAGPTPFVVTSTLGTKSTFWVGLAGQ